MTSNLGFGKPQPTAKAQPSKRSQERGEISKRYEKMQADGIPDFEVYIRIQGKKSWYPVGAIAVKRSSQIDKAIFDSEEQLLQGAFRLFPILRKHRQELEYGYRLKEYKDEPIQLAIPPQSSGANPVQAALNQLKNSVSSIFTKD